MQVRFMVKFRGVGFLTHVRNSSAWNRLQWEIALVCYRVLLPIFSIVL